METKSVIRAYRTRKTISKIYDYLNLGEQPDREDYVFAERGNYVQFATGIKSSNEKSFNIIWLLINKLNELSENILRKIVKNRKNAQSFVMFDYEDFSEGRVKEKD
jgi:hypothetical protein